MEACLAAKMTMMMVMMMTMMMDWRMQKSAWGMKATLGPRGGPRPPRVLPSQRAVMQVRGLSGWGGGDVGCRRLQVPAAGMFAHALVRARSLTAYLVFHFRAAPSPTPLFSLLSSEGSL